MYDFTREHLGVNCDQPFWSSGDILLILAAFTKKESAADNLKFLLQYAGSVFNCRESLVTIDRKEDQILLPIDGVQMISEE